MESQLVFKGGLGVASIGISPWTQDEQVTQYQKWWCFLPQTSSHLQYPKNISAPLQLELSKQGLKKAAAVSGQREKETKKEGKTFKIDPSREMGPWDIVKDSRKQATDTQRFPKQL